MLNKIFKTIGATMFLALVFVAAGATEAKAQSKGKAIVEGAKKAGEVIGKALDWGARGLVGKEIYDAARGPRETPSKESPSKPERSTPSRREADRDCTNRGGRNNKP